MHVKYGIVLTPCPRPTNMVFFIPASNIKHILSSKTLVKYSNRKFCTTEDFLKEFLTMDLKRNMIQFFYFYFLLFIKEEIIKIANINYPLPKPHFFDRFIRFEMFWTQVDFFLENVCLS